MFSSRSFLLSAPPMPCLLQLAACRGGDIGPAPVQRQELVSHSIRRGWSGEVVGAYPDGGGGIVAARPQGRGDLVVFSSPFTDLKTRSEIGKASPDGCANEVHALLDATRLEQAHGCRSTLFVSTRCRNTRWVPSFDGCADTMQLRAGCLATPPMLLAEDVTARKADNGAPTVTLLHPTDTDQEAWAHERWIDRESRQPDLRGGSMAASVSLGHARGVSSSIGR